MLFKLLAKVSDLEEGFGKVLLLEDGREILLFKQKGEIYAYDNACPHKGQPIGPGPLEDACFTCTWHGWQFDVSTGRHCLNANLQHQGFPVKLEGNAVLVELP